MRFVSSNLLYKYKAVRVTVIIFCHPNSLQQFFTKLYTFQLMKSLPGSIQSYFSRRIIQNLYVLPSLQFYSKGIYLVSCFQQVLSYLQFFLCPKTKFKSQPLKPREVTARYCMQTRVSQKGKCMMGIRTQNTCSVLFGVFLSSSSASEATWEPQKKNTPCWNQLPTPIIPSALPKQVTIIFGIGKATSSQGVHRVKTFPH